MAYSTNYTALKADIVRITEDNSTDLSSNLDTIIALAETQCLRDLDLEIFQQEIAAGALSIGTPTLAMPGSVIKANSMWVTTAAGAKVPVFQRTLGYCRQFTPNSADVAARAQPRYYAYKDESTLYFAPSPDIAYVVTIDGIDRPTGLSSLNATTWLSNYAGDLLLYACLGNAEDYLTNPEQAATWRNQYSSDRLPKAKLELRGMARATYQMARQGSQAVTPL